ncbi:DNA-binding GntR family transcriptional regulator [Streptomyces sp. V4I23]|uniref:GntR family transcriptional regulator n=1 Tax=Streptomyces sp. V4I23 TaxID=3042282 RepID=UPI002783DECD|nr:GntR family transcriptional regulator [Streptomyces sp. V4I23]MDQ1008769.1 DNA-binding GntR family transcriptional regulator [Streptomyces sp. V4I23]
MTRDPVAAAVRLPARQNLADDVHEALKAMIMDHVIEPGARVNVYALSRELGVSQTPLREALAHLEADGLVVKESLRGFFVAPLISRAQFEDLFEFRLLIEPWSAARAAERCGPEGHRSLRAELATCTDVPEGGEYADYKAVATHDHRFHVLVAELSGNDNMPPAFERTNCHLHIFRLFYQTYVGTAAIDEHGAVTDAITAGDPEAAEAAMRRHIESSRARLRAAFD